MQCIYVIYLFKIKNKYIKTKKNNIFTNNNLFKIFTIYHKAKNIFKKHLLMHYTKFSV